MSEADKALQRKRAALKGALTKYFNYFSDITNIDTSREALQVKEERLRATFAKFDTINLEICASDPSAVDTEVESKFMDVLVVIKKLLSQSNPSTQPQTTKQCKLPLISVPNFQGQYSQYRTFINLFDALIDKNSSLEDVQKLFYLRSFLQGEPLELIKNLPLVSESYIEAKTIIDERYNNSYKITNDHVSILLDIPPMHKSTAVNIRQFLSTVKQQLAALKNLGHDIDAWDPLVICILTRKLDTICNREFQLARDQKPTINCLLEFLDKRALALENAERQQPSIIAKAANVVNMKTPPSPASCSLCKLSHKLFICPQFKSMSSSERLKYVNDNKLCQTCLNCHTKKCRFFFKCDICKQRHNTLLHQDNNQSPVTLFLKSNSEQVLLPTARVKIVASNGTVYHVKALLDSGSQTSFVTSELVDLLKIKTNKIQAPVIGIGNTTSHIRESVNIQVHSLTNEFLVNVTCYKLDKITSKLPQIKINLKNLRLPLDIPLADRDFNIPSVIHVLLGADVFFQVLLPPEHCDKHSSVQDDANSNTTTSLPVLNTQFGYVIAGSVPTALHAYPVTSLFCNKCDNTLNDTLTQFWKTESIPDFFPESLSEHEACEKLFCDTVSLDTKNKKFQVALPLKLPLESINETLGYSYNLALKRFYNLEIRFQKDSLLHKLYIEFINDYKQQGHGTVVDINQYNLHADPVYFLPHHPVLRLDKKTTKCRVVFDGSMKTNLKISLNDLLLNGSVVQKELVDILLLFRVSKFIFITDIKGMFREVSLDPKYRSLQNILWRDSPQDDIQCIQLNTVTYGLKSSSYLATRCLKELAVRYKQEFPLAAFIIENCMYVDDALFSQPSSELLIESKRQLYKLLEIGGFHLHKWYSNCPRLLEEIPKQLQHFDDIELEKSDASLKTLGINFNPKTDSFMLSSPNASNAVMPASKREILSFIGKFYDPLGLAGPVVVKAKVIMQKLWQAQIDWDERPNEELMSAWCEFYNSLSNMSPVAIPRYINLCTARYIQIIGYADAASCAAYGCCVYLRVVDNSDNVKVSLLGSRSRVNPSKQCLTVPRLELNSALLLAKLVTRMFNILQLQLKIDEVILYSDSQIVLAWIQTNIAKLNTYVANRVKVISQLTNSFKWLYVSSDENPADCLSRGILPEELHTHPLWWRGPGVINTCKYSPGNVPELPIPCDLPEAKGDTALSSAMLCTVSNEQTLCSDFLNKYSNISKMQRILAYVLRFAQNAKNKSVQNKSNYLTSKELNDALLLIVKYEQQIHLKDDIDDLKCKEKIVKGNLKPLSPFIDDRGLVRVGGRLENSALPYSQKHPVILPRDSRVTTLIIESEHIKNLHAGPRLLLSTINQKFWIVHGMREIKKVVHKCLICFKLKGTANKQLMGSLPYDRINVCRPYKKIGLDFCGPILIRQSRVRKALETKAYVCVFVCFVTKAIHLELTSDLKTDTFLACLKRFISRRGLPTDIYCDNASTFRCASSQLHNLYKLQSSKEHQAEVHAFTSQNNINFHFVPCYSPTFAGLAEAGVKSMKFHLKRVVQKALLTYEELNTVICQIEAILNSRPLMPLSSDANDFSCLTPGHFVIGTALNSYPEPDESVTHTNNLKFWKLCTSIRNSFWKVWSKNYLNSLQSRPKWREPQPNVKVGSLVILKDDNTAPMYWPMARIVQVYPGSDNKVRVVEVKTANGRTHKRSIVKICVLPVESDSEV